MHTFETSVGKAKKFMCQIIDFLSTLEKVHLMPRHFPVDSSVRLTNGRPVCHLCTSSSTLDCVHKSWRAALVPPKLYEKADAAPYRQLCRGRPCVYPRSVDFVGFVSAGRGELCPRQIVRGLKPAVRMRYGQARKRFGQ